MADKTKTSPLKQGWAGSIIGSLANQVQAPPTTSTNNGYLWGMGGAATAPQTAQAAAIGAQQQPISSGSIMGGAAGAVATAMQGYQAKPTSSRPMAKALQNPISAKALSNQKNIKGVFGTQSPGTFTRNMQSPLQQATEPPLGVEEEISPTYDLANN